MYTKPIKSRWLILLGLILNFVSLTIKDQNQPWLQLTFITSGIILVLIGIAFYAQQSKLGLATFLIGFSLGIMGIVADRLEIYSNAQPIILGLGTILTWSSLLVAYIDKKIRNS